MQPVATQEPQQARAIETRRKLLVAARDMLIEAGLHGTTTNGVVQRAGVSQGALFRHFPSKAVLLAETLEFIGEELLAQFVAGFSRVSPEEDFVAAGVEVAWNVIDQPATSAILEILVASRTDETLRALIEPAANRFYEKIYRELSRFSPPLVEMPVMTSVLWMMIDVMNGRMFANLAGRNEAFNRAQRELLVQMVRDKLMA